MNKAGKKTHWLRTTLIVLVICGLVGTVVAGVKFTGNKASTYAASTLQMNFANAAGGLAPNGHRINVQEMASDEVLQNALDAASLSGTYTPDQIRSSLQIQGVYPEDLEEQFTRSVSVLNNTGSGSAMLKISDYHPTTFNAVLSNEFDPSISQAQLTSLLDHILSAYKTYFTAVGANKLETGFSVFEISDYDYVQQLKILRAKMESLSVFAAGMGDKNSTFRLEGKGFSDIYVRIGNLIAGDLSRLEGQVTVGALSKDNNRLLTQYQYEVESLTDELKYKTENLEKINKLVDGYKKNATIYILTGAALKKVSENSTDTYDKIVEQQKEMADEIANTKIKIADYQQKIEDIKNGTAAAAEKTAETEGEDAEAAAEKKETASAGGNKVDEAVLQKLEADIGLLISRLQGIITDLDAMIQAENAEQINYLTVSTSGVSYYTPRFLSGTFAKQVIKTAGPFCALGLMVCLMLIFISRRKEEKVQG